MSLKQIGALWVRTPKKGGKKFLAGNLDLSKLHAGDASELDIVIFENKEDWLAENPKRPRFQILTDEDNVAGETTNGDDEDDSIPF